MALLAIWLLAAGNALAAGASAPCTAPEYRQFDFWVGSWDVYDPSGTQLLGHSRVERSANGCWITELWQSAKGGEGTSLNAWDAKQHCWRQFWVGGDGTVLRLQGALAEDGAMQMFGPVPGSEGNTQQQRLRWSTRADGTVVQEWSASAGAGHDWKTVFVGVYRRP